MLSTSVLSAEKTVLITDYLKDNIPIQQKITNLQKDSLSLDYIPVKLQIGEGPTLLFKVQLAQLLALLEQEKTALSLKDKSTVQLNNDPQYLMGKQPDFPPNNWTNQYLLNQSTFLLLLLYGFIYAFKEGKIYWQANSKASEEEAIAAKESKETPVAKNEELVVAAPEFSMEEINWLVNLQQTVEQNMSNINFDVTQLASHLAISSRHLNRRIRQYTRFSTNQFIQEIRLTTAKKLLTAQAYKSVKAVAYEVGYKDVKYFGQLFKKRFGHLPSIYFKKKRIGLMT